MDTANSRHSPLGSAITSFLRLAMFKRIYIQVGLLLRICSDSRVRFRIVGLAIR